LTEAQDAVDAAKAQLGTIDTMVSEAVTAEDPRTAWQRAKTQYLAIKESITSAHTSLRATVEALKVAIDQAQAEASEPTE
jgi:hypothetical protein